MIKKAAFYLVEHILMKLYVTNTSTVQYISVLSLTVLNYGSFNTICDFALHCTLSECICIINWGFPIYHSLNPQLSHGYNTNTMVLL